MPLVCFPHSARSALRSIHIGEIAANVSRETTAHRTYHPTFKDADPVPMPKLIRFGAITQRISYSAWNNVHSSMSNLLYPTTMLITSTLSTVPLTSHLSTNRTTPSNRLESRYSLHSFKYLHILRLPRRSSHTTALSHFLTISLCHHLTVHVPT